MPAGRPPIWDTRKVATKVSEIQSVWWTQIEQMMNSRNPGERKFALAEFNKLQVKAMPQALTGEDGEPFQPMTVNVLNTPADELLRILTAASANSAQRARRPAKASSRP